MNRAILCLFALLVAYFSATVGPRLSANLQFGFLAHAFRLYSQPILLAALLCGLLALLPSARNRRSFSGVAILLAAAFIYIALDLIHYGIGSGAFQAFKDLFYNKVIASYLVMALLLGVFIVIGKRLGPIETYKATIVLMTMFAATSLLLWAVAKLGLHSFADLEVTNNNLQAYESCGVLLLLLFAPRRLFSPTIESAIVAVHGLVPVFHQSRGGMLVGLYLLGGYLLLTGWRNGWRPLVMDRLPQTTLALSAVLVAGLLGLFQAGSASAGPSALDRSPDQPLTGHLADLARSRELKHNLDSNREISSSDDVVSAYSRLGTTVLALKAWAQSPVSGIGIWNAYNDIEVGTFGIHGLVPLLMAGYGTLGLVPLLAMIFVLCRGRRTSWSVRLHVVLVILLVGMFLNRYPWWLAGVLWSFSDETNG